MLYTAWILDTWAYDGDWVVNDRTYAGCVTIDKDTKKAVLNTLYDASIIHTTDLRRVYVEDTDDGYEIGARKGRRPLITLSPQ